MESLERFQQSRAVIEDFSSQTLAAISSDFGRLYYIASLKNRDSGRYEHEGLSEVYPETSVQQAITHCHEELFSRILETPLSEQQQDLGACLVSAGEQYWDVIESWLETRYFERMCPDGLPYYLQDLFCSNLHALLSIIEAGKAS